MVAEQGSIEIYDGTNKAFEDFQFDLTNKWTYVALTGKSETERNAATHMMAVLERSNDMTIDEAKTYVATGPAEELQTRKGASELLYVTLALSTAGRAKQIVKETSVARNGPEAWVRLRERYSKATGATSYAEIFKFNWQTTKSFEDNWRNWTSKMSRLPTGSLSDPAKEALAIEAASASHQTALEQHLRLKAPQPWMDLVASVDAYLATMYVGGKEEPTPMEIGAVGAWQDGCQCCGKKGHTKAECRLKDATCLKCGKIGHIGAVCRSSGKGYGKQKGKGKGKDGKKGNNSNNEKACMCCGRSGHTKASCRFKDEKCSLCGKVGHLKAVCRKAQAARQVEDEHDTSDVVENASAHYVELAAQRSWAMMVQDLRKFDTKAADSTINDINEIMMSNGSEFERIKTN
jgi:hypothetical protein